MRLIWRTNHGGLLFQRLQVIVQLVLRQPSLVFRIFLIIQKEASRPIYCSGIKQEKFHLRTWDWQLGNAFDHELREPMRERRGLAGTGARDDQQRFVTAMEHRRALRRIQAGVRVETVHLDI